MPIKAGAIASLTLSTALSVPLPQIALLVAVAQFDGLVGAGAGAARHGGAADGAVAENHVDLDGRVAAAVEDFAGVDRLNGGAHRRLAKEVRR